MWRRKEGSANEYLTMQTEKPRDSYKNTIGISNLTKLNIKQRSAINILTSLGIDVAHRKGKFTAIRNSPANFIVKRFHLLGIAQEKFNGSFCTILSYA